MIVMGGIIGSGIFMNPSVVAQQVHTPSLILGAWLVGGVIGLAGAFIGKVWNERTYAARVFTTSVDVYPACFS